MKRFITISRISDTDRIEDECRPAGRRVTAGKPMAVLLPPKVLLARAPCPTAVLSGPVVLRTRALPPTAVLLLPLLCKSA